MKLKINWNFDDHKAASHSYIVKDVLPSEEDVTQLHLPKETKLNVSFSELQVWLAILFLRLCMV